MMIIESEAHKNLILEQFTKQAIPFSNIPGHSDEKVAEIMINFSGVTAEDTVLDVACGPGLITFPFARIADKVTGMDITPKMLERAKELQIEKGIKNITWDIGDIYSLPYDDNSFSMVITRYSFHHLLNPQNALKEIKRVCKINGKIVVIDVCAPSEKQESYNHFETLRDPSHTKALNIDEFIKLFETAGIANIKTKSYLLEIELENQIKSSFPNKGDDEKMREIIKKDLGINKTGFNPVKRDNKYYLYYPNIICVGQKID
jgi:ubiquinone/menaquinone biosynthesis C-methylase UbiE